MSDLTVVDVTTGQVALAWTQINAGDLDLNGEVNSADLASIAKHFNATYDINDPNKRSLPEFWADGDGNGEINGSDIAAIGQHYKAAIAGYNIRRNGQLIPGSQAGEPTILPSMGVQSDPALPKRFSILMLGAASDTWVVTAVDYGNAEGVTTSGAMATTDLIANLTVNGVPMLDLNGSNPGGFSGTKFSSRIIEPVENPYGLQVKPIALNGTTSIFTGVPRAKIFFLTFSYLPSINLSTGVQHAPSGARRGSADDPGLVTTAVPFQLPPGASTAQVDSNITLTPNPDGGYYVVLANTLTIPGQPSTTTHTRLAYASGTLSRDTNSDGVYDDEASYTDDDRDCISNALLQSCRDSDEFLSEDRVEGKLVGTIGAVDSDQGTITLSSRTLVGGELALPDAPLTLHFNEQLHLDGLHFANLVPGIQVQMEFYLLRDSTGQKDDVFWIKSIEPKTEHSDGFLEASDAQHSVIKLRWNKPVGFASFQVVRYSPAEPSGNYSPNPDWQHVFDSKDTDQYEDADVVPGTVYLYRYFGIDGQTFIQLGSDTGVALPPD